MLGIDCSWITERRFRREFDRFLFECFCSLPQISQLNGDMERVKIDQQRLEQELDFVLSQQLEQEEMLRPLEAAVEQLPVASHQQHADLEREHTWV